MRVRFSASSDVGMRREVNQDAYGSDRSDQATLLVVCDGMGGHAAGEVASKLGVETIIASLQREAPPEEALREAFSQANLRIYSEGRGSMGTTGVAALFAYNALYVANVGDSRAYLIREGGISQISHDHSFVSDQVAAGLMTAEQARSSNIRNIITRALGHQATVEVDTFQVELRPGDTVVLSTDGMHGLIEDAEIAEIAGVLPLDAVAQRLVDIANERGGNDNITVMVAQVDELDGPSEAAAARASAAPAPAAPAPAPATPVERPLSRAGMALALITLLALIGIGGLALFVEVPPASAPAPGASPAPALGSPGATSPSPLPRATSPTAAAPSPRPSPTAP